MLWRKTAGESMGGLRVSGFGKFSWRRVSFGRDFSEVRELGHVCRGRAFQEEQKSRGVRVLGMIED